jgi:hypothetical protein
LKQRNRLDQAASRRLDKFRSDRLKKLSAEMMNEMLDSQKNLVRDQSWSVQIEHFHLNIVSRTMQATFNQRTSRVSRFKKAKVRKISNKNKELRMQYAKEHETHTVHNFWQYVHFSDEAHFDSNQTFSDRVLREEETRYEPENMQTMLDMKSVKLHVVVFIS